VQKDSSIKTVADLKGKKIGLNKGSNVHYLLVRALDKAGLKYTDVELVFLPPADGRAAFEKSAVDAWVIWEPYPTKGFWLYATAPMQLSSWAYLHCRKDESAMGQIIGPDLLNCAHCSNNRSS
jgi:TRAP-type uncharacterized transport system substrate-binding protein